MGQRSACRSGASFWGGTVGLTSWWKEAPGFAGGQGQSWRGWNGTGGGVRVLPLGRVIFFEWFLAGGWRPPGSALVQATCIYVCVRG